MDNKYNYVAHMQFSVQPYVFSNMILIPKTFFQQLNDFLYVPLLQLNPVYFYNTEKSETQHDV